MKRPPLYFYCSLLFFLFLASVHPDQWYRISEMELGRLETISQTWETDRQKAQLQASVLTEISTSLQTESATLKQQLAAEREALRSLRKSSEQHEADQYQRAVIYETDIKNLQAINSNLEKDKLKLQKAVLLLASVLSFFVLAGIAVIVIRLKRPP